MNINKLELLNYICTSDSDLKYIQNEKIRKAKLLKILYLITILLVITLSFIPLFANIDYQSTITRSYWMLCLNIVILSVLLIDYIFRWITYPIRVGNDSKHPLIVFPFTGVSFIMILSIIPTLLAIFARLVPQNHVLIQVFNILSILKILRLILLLNAIPSFKIFIKVFERQKMLVINVFALVIVMILIFALLIYSAEGGKNIKINNYWDALYFTFITVTTIGYGDIVPVTQLGRVVIIFVSFLGIIIFSIPSGIIAGTFMYEIQSKYKKEHDGKNKNKAALIEKLITNSKITINKNKKNGGEITKNILLIRNIEKQDINSELCSKIKETLGSGANVESFDFDEHGILKVKIKSQNKITINFYSLIELFNLNCSFE